MKINLLKFKHFYLIFKYFFCIDPLLGCVPIDECANAPCAYGAMCVNQKGGMYILIIFILTFCNNLKNQTGYVCECPPGMSGDPYKSGCVYTDPTDKKFQCNDNNDCAANLYCSESKTCISPCTNLLCGANAFCEPENHAGWCRCKIGFEENSNGECVSCKYIKIMLTGIKKNNRTISK